MPTRVQNEKPQVTQFRPGGHHLESGIILLFLKEWMGCWGLLGVAGCLALRFNALLRPGEIFGALRKDPLLPSDLDFSIEYALISIQELKSRFTYARHQTGKADSSDMVGIIELAFSGLFEHERLWPFGLQTLRNRLKSLLALCVFQLRALVLYEH